MGSGLSGDGVEIEGPGVLSCNEIEIEVPEGWSGRAFRLEGPERSWLQLANFRLPDRATPAGEVDRLKALEERDILITLVSRSDQPARRAEGPLIGEESFVDGSPRVPAGMRLALQSFCLDATCFDLDVTFGNEQAEASSIAAANDVLSTLTMQGV